MNPPRTSPTRLVPIVVAGSPRTILALIIQAGVTHEHLERRVRFAADRPGWSQSGVTLGLEWR